jgi:hypothetical protein
MSGCVFELVGSNLRRKGWACGMIYRVQQLRLSHRNSSRASFTLFGRDVTTRQMSAGEERLLRTLPLRRPQIKINDP